MRVKKQLAYNERNYILRIPVPMMKGMGWGVDELIVEANPDANTITLHNPKREAIGWLRSRDNIKEAKYLRNKKKYLRELNQNLSPEGRLVLHNTNWSEVEDGGYWNIQLRYLFS